MTFKRSLAHRRGLVEAVEGDLGFQPDQNINGGGGVLPSRKRVVTIYETHTPEGWNGGLLTTLKRSTSTPGIQQTVTRNEGGDEQATPFSADATPRTTGDSANASKNDGSSTFPTVIMASTASDPSVGGTLALATGAATSTSISPPVAAAPTAASPTTPSHSAPSDSTSGSSDGATKAGIAIGVLAAIFVVLGLVYILVAKRKRQIREQQRLADDEKLDGPFGDYARAPPTPAKPPRLSLRPITQLFLGSPSLAERRASRGPSPQGIAMVSSPTMKRTPSGSPWERPTTSDSQNVHNPFGNHAETFLEDLATYRNPASPMTPISEVSLVPSPTFAAGLSPAPRASALTTNSAILAPLVTHQSGRSTPTPQQAFPDGVVPTPLHVDHFGGNTSTPSASDAPASTSGAAAGGTIVPCLQRKQSVRKDNLPAPLDLTLPPKLGAVPPSPAGTEFSFHEVESEQATEPSAGAAAIAAAGGPVDSAVHRVQLDFRPTMDDEMELHTGQVVRLLHEYDDGWALCIRLDRSQQGVVPRTCLSTRPVKPRLPQQASPRGPPIKSQGPPQGPPPGPPGPPVSSQRGPGPNHPPGNRPIGPPGGPTHPLAPGTRGPGPMRPMSPPSGYPGRPGPLQPMGPQMETGPRPQSPEGQRPQSPAGQRSQSPSGQGQHRSQSPNGISRRPSSPGPSAVQQESRPNPDESQKSSPRGPPQGPVSRKPVPGQAY